MGQMATGSLAMAISTTAAGAVWLKVARELKSELGDAAFGSWLAQAAVRSGPVDEPCLVAHTGVARDWIRRYAWRRIGELWSVHDAAGRGLTLKSRAEFDAGGLGGVGAPAEGRVTLAGPTASAELETAAFGSEKASSVAPCQQRYTFDAFVTGSSNEFAHAVARRVASWADGLFNPVVVHGPYGFGKTHLLHAIEKEAMDAGPGRRVVYVKAEQFLSSFVRAVMEKQMVQFKDEMRGADLLLIDDVHLMGGKQSTQEELVHTLAALMEDGKRVVISADRPPSALTEIDARLRSHLSSGLVCGIEPADRAMRLGILARKLPGLCAQLGVEGSLRPEVLEFLADRFTDNVRELEGALNTMVACAGGNIGALGLNQAQCLLRTNLRGGERRVTVDDIQKATAEHFSLKQADLISERRTRAVARPRQAAMWLAKQLTTRSLPDIGRRFGGRDHTTVLHAVRRIEELRAGDPQLARDLELLMRKLRG